MALFIWRNLDPAIFAALLLFAARRYVGNRAEPRAARRRTHGARHV